MALFGIPDMTDIVLDSLKYLIDQNRMHVHGFVIMEHHIHLIATSEKLSKEIGDLKSYTARQIVDHLTAKGYKAILNQMQFFKKRHKTDQKYQVWEEGSHPQLIETTTMLNQKLDYIHYNPVRAGYVDDPMHWRYSSYRFYCGMDCLLPITVLH
jgi:REP element-mobilizing transposase RayT